VQKIRTHDFWNRPELALARLGSCTNVLHFDLDTEDIGPIPGSHQFFKAYNLSDIYSPKHVSLALI
jgi:hypothetical protein